MKYKFDAPRARAPYAQFDALLRKGLGQLCRFCGRDLGERRIVQGRQRDALLMPGKRLLE